MAIILNLHFATDLTEFTTTTVGAGCTLESSAASGMGYTHHGLTVTAAVNTTTYGYRSFTAITSTSYRFRFYFDPNGVLGNSGLSDIFRIYPQDPPSSTYNYLAVRFRETAAVLNIAMTIWSDDGSTQISTDNYPITDAPHWIEVLVNKAATTSSNDGSYSLYIDDVLKVTKTGIDLFNAFGARGLYLGDITLTNPARTWLFDEVVIRDDNVLIGEAPTIPLYNGASVRCVREGSTRKVQI